MASNRNPNDNDSERKRIEDNPFVSFRRFADEQVSALLNISMKMIGLPESDVVKAADDQKRGSACQGWEQRNSYTPTVEDGREGGYGRERRTWHCQRGQNSPDDNEEGKNWGRDYNHGAGSQLGRQTKTEVDQQSQVPKVHTWHWSWSYPPATSEEIPRAGIEGRIENLWKHAEDMIRTNLSASPEPPFPALGFGSNFTMAMIHYLTQSDYSPLQLESSISESEIAWREAFEDLLRAQTGQPLLSQRELQQTNQTSRGNWTSQLLYRTLWNSHMNENGKRSFWSRPSIAESIREAPFSHDAESRIPSSRWLFEFDADVDADDDDEHDSYEYGHDHEDQPEDPPTPRPDTSTFARFSEAEFEDGPETELDAYERLLGPKTLTPSKNHEDNSPSRPSVLSTLTTTERTTHPDGTVTTKMVLKKRFADGREESSETIHTTQGHDKQVESAFLPEAARQQQIEQKEIPSKQNAEKKGRGWFWS